MQSFNLDKITVTGGFVKEKLEQNASVTAKSVYERFVETGRFGALQCKKTDIVPYVFWDSDVAKWLEGTAHILARKEDADLRKILDETIDTLCKNQREDGYFNSYFLVHEPSAIFMRRVDHELYTAGHFIEAGVAVSERIKDDRLLQFSIKFADLIYERFYIRRDTGFVTPGHQEIELALVKLYRHTKDKKYLTLAKFFLDERGKKKEEGYYDDEGESIYLQNDVPVYEENEARGHAVRQLYQIVGMIDVGVETGDTALIDVSRRLVEDILTKKLYITGGVGSSHIGENFTNAYDLPNESAYAETCASIALVFALERLYKIDENPMYADAIERIVYNGVYSGLSLDGDKFFYINPLEVWMEKYEYNERLGSRKQPLYIPERVKVFWCSCCPPNIVRFTEQTASFAYYQKENTLTIAQYISSRLQSDLADVEVVSAFPYGGKVTVKADSHGKEITLKLRIPSWSGKAFDNAENGYLIYTGVFAGETMELDFCAEVKKTYPNAKVRADDGKIALTYGPLVLCAEGADNDNLCGVRIGDIQSAKVAYTEKEKMALKVQVPVKIRTEEGALYSYNPPVYKDKVMTFIPYFAWGNRGKNDMKVFFTDD